MLRKKILIFLLALCVGGLLPVLAASARQNDLAFAEMLSVRRLVRTVIADYQCRKIMTDQSVIASSGTLFAARGGNARYCTTQPYRSELILAGGKMYARTQHEKNWVKKNQPDKPGMTAVMVHVAAWSVGDLRDSEKLFDMAKLNADDMPADMMQMISRAEMPSAEYWRAVPVNQNLQKVVRQISLIFSGELRQLSCVQVRLVDDEVVTYVFAPRDNAELPANMFEPAFEPQQNQQAGE